MGYIKRKTSFFHQDGVAQSVEHWTVNMATRVRSAGEFWNVSANQRSGRFWFSDQPEKKPTNLVKDVEILLPVKFGCISFSCCRREVGNVRADLRPGQPSWLSHKSEKHTRCRERWIHALGQSEARDGYRGFLNSSKKHKPSRGCWNLTSREVSLSYVVPLQRTSPQCEKLTID